MKKWVNVFVDYYDKEQYYVTKSYETKIEALLGVRNSMKDRYIATIDLSVILNKILKPKKVKKTEDPAFVITENKELLQTLSKLLNSAIYGNLEEHRKQFEKRQATNPGR